MGPLRHIETSTDYFAPALESLRVKHGWLVRGDEATPSAVDV